jgi:hypothetical protein
MSACGKVFPRAWHCSGRITDHPEVESQSPNAGLFSGAGRGRIHDDTRSCGPQLNSLWCKSGYRCVKVVRYAQESFLKSGHGDGYTEGS